MQKRRMRLKANRREIFSYLIFGFLTTAVNILIFMAFTYILGEKLYLISNLIAWIGAVIFAFVVNKLFVFKSSTRNMRKLMAEILEFIGARVFSFLFEELGLFVLVKLTPLGKVSFDFLTFAVTGQLISKIILAVIVVILNYFFSKYVIFKKKT